MHRGRAEMPRPGGQPSAFLLFPRLVQRSFFMKEKTFHRILIAVTVIGSLSVIALTVYTILLYKDVSVIAFVANGG